MIVDKPSENKIQETVRPSPIAEVYSDPQNVIDEILRIRELFGDRRTTEKQFQAIFWALGAMMIYAPESKRVLVESTLIEATRREMHYRLHIWKKAA